MLLVRCKLDFTWSLIAANVRLGRYLLGHSPLLARVDSRGHLRGVVILLQVWRCGWFRRRRLRLAILFLFSDCSPVFSRSHIDVSLLLTIAISSNCFLLDLVWMIFRGDDRVISSARDFPSGHRLLLLLVWSHARRALTLILVRVGQIGYLNDHFSCLFCLDAGWRRLINHFFGAVELKCLVGGRRCDIDSCLHLGWRLSYPCHGLERLIARVFFPRWCENCWLVERLVNIMRIYGAHWCCDRLILICICASSSTGDSHRCSSHIRHELCNPWIFPDGSPNFHRWDSHYVKQRAEFMNTFSRHPRRQSWAQSMAKRLLLMLHE